MHWHPNLIQFQYSEFQYSTGFSTWYVWSWSTCTPVCQASPVALQKLWMNASTQNMLGRTKVLAPGFVLRSGYDWQALLVGGLEHDFFSKKTRWSPRTRMLTRMLMVQMSKHMVMQSRTIPFCNSLFEQSCACFPCYQSAVWSGKCRVWSVEWEVRSVECKVWSGECRVCKV